MELLFVHLSNELLKAICWTLIHSLWLGALAAALAGIIILFTRKTTARLRYNLLGNVLILFVLATFITFCFELQSNDRSEEAVALQLNIHGSVVPDLTGEVTAAVAPASFIEKAVAYFNAQADRFVLVWALFFMIHLIKIGTGLTGVRRIRRHKIHSSSDWQVRLSRLGQQLGIRQTVRLLQSELVKVPVAVGFFKPMILVPLGLFSHLPPEQVETILLHELAHIRRRDYLVNLLQCLAEAIFFFNPALLWISSRLRQEREACCDDIVVEHTTNKGSYLEALVSFHEYAITPSYAMGIGGKRYYLLNRVKRMLTRENKKLNLMEKTLLLLGITVITAFTFVPQQEGVIVKKAVPETVLSVIPVSAQDPIAEHPVNISQKSRKKEMDQPVMVPISSPHQQQVVIHVDTVPSPNKNRNAYDGLNFSGISSNTNENGDTRTETVTAIDQHGKKYMVSRLNNKVTALTIDGVSVPENQIDDYAGLIRKIEGAAHSKKRDDWKVKEDEWKQKGKEWEIKGKEIEKEIKQKMKEKQKEFDQEKKEKDREIKEKQKEIKERQKEAQERAKEPREQQKKRNNPGRGIRKDTMRISSGNYHLQFDQNLHIPANVNMNISKDIRVPTNALHLDVRSPRFDFASKMDIQTKLNFNVNLSVPPQSTDARAKPAPAKSPQIIQ